MPINRIKKCTTPTPLGSMQEQTMQALPDQQTFQQHLRKLARGAVRVVLEAVMSKELDAFIGAAWGECICTKSRWKPSWQEFPVWMVLVPLSLKGKRGSAERPIRVAFCYQYS